LLIKYQTKEKDIKHIERSLSTAYKMSIYEARYYAYMLYDYTREFPLDSNWRFLGAVAYVENRWYAIGRSRNDAGGIMQTTPATTKAYAESLGIDYRRDTTEYNPILSLAIGSKYLSKWHDVSMSNAIRSYVGGPGHAKLKKQTYINDYEKNIMHEYKKLCLIEQQLRLETK
jgi:membrane-bound lytic murein transglycosylase MltF